MKRMTLRNCKRSTPNLAAVAIALVLVWPLESGRAQLPPVRAEGVAALVGGNHPGPNVTVLLRSDVVLRAYMHLWRGGGRGTVPQPNLLQAAQDELIGEALIAIEASRMQVVSSRSIDVASERLRLVEGVGGAEALKMLLIEVGASAIEVDLAAERRARVALFLSANLDGEAVVTEAAVDTALLAQGKSEPQSVDSERRAQVRSELAKESYRGAVSRWVEVLRARNVVRVFANYGTRP